MHIRGGAMLQLVDASCTGDRSSGYSSEKWTQHVGKFSEVPALIRSLGVDPLGLLEAAGLSPCALKDAEARVSYARLGRLLASASEATGCAHLGLLIGR